MAKLSSDRGARRGAQVTSAAWRQASKALAHPAVQDLIVDNSQVVIDAAKEWADDAGDRIADWGGRFGQKGLERRSARLRKVIGELSGESLAAAESFRPVIKALDEVDKLLKVAAALPFAKRKRAHRKIDRRLKDLEAGLFDSVLGESPSA